MAFGRRRGPGLVGMAARTAVVAGTATAVSGRVGRRQQQKYANQDAAAMQQQDPGMEQAPSAGGGDDTTAQLEQLAKLKQEGILTEEEFTAKKKQVPGSEGLGVGRRRGTRRRPRTPPCSRSPWSQGSAHRDPDGESALNYLCSGYKIFFGQVDAPMRRMKDSSAPGASPTRSARKSSPRMRTAGATTRARVGTGSSGSGATAMRPEATQPCVTSARRCRSVMTRRRAAPTPGSPAAAFPNN